jgi:hypothetical protein
MGKLYVAANMERSARCIKIEERRGRRRTDRLALALASEKS